MDTKKMTKMGFLIALSVVGSYITIFMSIALDSLPGFFAALALGASAGGVVGALGHFMTALVHGFPLGLPVHILMMLIMFLACYFLGYFYKKSPYFALGGALVINWIVGLVLSSLLSYFMGVIPSPFFLVGLMFVPLLLGSLFNLVPAYMLYLILEKRYELS